MRIDKSWLQIMALWAVAIAGWVLVACLTGCVTEEVQDPDCGLSPNRPGYALTYDGRYVVMPYTMWREHELWMLQMARWAACKEGQEVAQ